MKYVQRSGRLTDTNGRLTAIGYSGHGLGLNRPDMQDVDGIGPIPIGLYTINAPLDPVDHLGPVAMPLVPDAANEMHGRSGFFIHGNDASMDHKAREGCIVIEPREAREEIRDGYDKQLRVVAEDPEAGDE